MTDIRTLLVDAATRGSRLSLELDKKEIVSGIAEEYIPANVLSEQIKIRTADGGAVFVPLWEIAVAIRFQAD
jgi:hypothetical protein